MAYVRSWRVAQKNGVQTLQSTESSSLLFLFKDVLFQATSYDIPHIIQKLNDKRGHAETPTKAMEPDNVMGIHLRKHLACTVRLLETTLACLYLELEDKSTMDRLVSLKRREDAENLDKLRRLCEPSIATLEQYTSTHQLPGDTESFEILLRRTKARLYGYDY